MELIGVHEGAAVHRLRLASGAGLAAEVMTCGAALARVTLDGRDVVLPLPDLAAWQADAASVNVLVGRFANRIAGGRFVLDGRTVRLAVNGGAHTLHGGPVGLSRRVWSVADAGADRVRLEIVSADGDQGFPGRLAVACTYALDGRTLIVDLEAETDAPTPVSLTQHAYFSLGGAAAGAHWLQIDAETLAPSGADLIPTGEIVALDGHPFDFREGRLLGAQAEALDHFYPLPGSGLRRAARIAAAGMGMEVWTTQPGLQAYGSGTLGPPYGRGAAICLETQDFPDAPNHPAFPDAILRPGEVYWHRTEFRFT